MRKVKLTLTVIAGMAILVTNCKKKDPDPTDANPTNATEITVETTSSAKAEDDTKSSGVYKGTFVGSSGTFKLTLESGDISGILVVDGETYQLSTSSITADDLGSAISNAVFTDSEGKVNLSFSVGADGSNPTVSLTIEGHTNINVSVYKETSTNQIKVYEGMVYYWYSDTGYAYQCAFNVNIALTDTVNAIYKYNSSIAQVGTADCDTQDEGTIKGYTYSISGNTINMFKMVSECDTCAPFKEGFLSISENGEFSENHIFFKSGAWSTPNGTFVDSCRLDRVL